MTPPATPLPQFWRWYEQALVHCADPNRMALATVAEDGTPSLRIVYLRPGEDQAFRFYTNYESQKGRQLQNDGRLAALLHWPELGRQVRLVGRATVCDADVSDRYFDSRSEGSRFAAAWSPQSRPLLDLEALRTKVRSALSESRLPPPRPRHWGGFEIQIEQIEFWCSGEHRLHERILVYRDIDDEWRSTCLAP